MIWCEVEGAGKAPLKEIVEKMEERTLLAIEFEESWERDKEGAKNG